MTVSLVITVQGFDEAQARLRVIKPDRIVRGSKFFIQKRIRESESQIRQEAPVGETNVLASSISVDAEEKGNAVIAHLNATARHAKWVHEGTGEFGPARQAIIPTDRLVMTFFKEGKWIRTRKVRGQPANPFLARGARVLRDKMASTLPREIRQDIQLLISGRGS